MSQSTEDTQCAVCSAPLSQTAGSARSAKTFLGVLAPVATDGYMDGDRFVVTTDGSEYLCAYASDGLVWMKLSPGPAPDLSGYATKAELSAAVAGLAESSALADLATKSYVAGLGYATESFVSSAVAGLATSASVTAALQPYVKASDADAKYLASSSSSSMLPKSEFAEHLKTAVVIPKTDSSYPSVLSLTSILAGYATASSVSSLSDAVSSLSSGLDGKVSSDSDFAKCLVRRAKNSDGTFKQVDLDAVLSSYCTKAAAKTEASSAVSAAISQTVSSSTASVPSCAAVKAAVKVVSDAVDRLKAQPSSSSSSSGGGYVEAAMDPYLGQSDFGRFTFPNPGAGGVVLVDCSGMVSAAAAGGTVPFHEFPSVVLVAANPPPSFRVVLSVPAKSAFGYVDSLSLSFDVSVGAFDASVSFAAGVPSSYSPASGASACRLVFDVVRTGSSSFAVVSRSVVAGA